MKKGFLPILMALFCAGSLFAQTTLISDNFDSYTAGSKLASQAGAPWSTWSSAPGGSEDPAVSDAQSHSASNSVYVANDNDCILNFSDKTTGRYSFSFYIYVSSGSLGYYNLLQDFASSNSKWGMQVYFKTNNYAVIDANGASADSLAYTPDTWIHVLNVIDLDDDFATTYLDGVELYSWQWSKGAQGDQSTVKLDAANFYGWNESSLSSGYYLDDVEFVEYTAPEAPINLTATLNGTTDVDLSWNAPGSGTPDSYTIMANGNIIATGVTNITYTHTNVYPNTYDYTVRAHYANLGYSHSSNTANATVPGGVSRNVTLFEIATGTWCGYCPGAAMGADDLVSNGKDVAIIEYHAANGDPFEITESVDRINYYNAIYFPTTKVDGVKTMEGGSATTSLYSSYLVYYNERIAVPSVHNINIAVTDLGSNNYQAVVTVEETSHYFTSGLKLQTALTESNIAYSWQNQTKLDFVCRGMYPDASGTTLDFSSATTQTETFNFTMDASWNLSECEFVAFVQHDPTMEVTQAAAFDMSQLVGIESVSMDKIALYPNPATDVVNVFTNGTGKLSVYNIAGQLILTKEFNSTNTSIDVSEFVEGMYFVEVETASGKYNEKLVVK